MYLRDLSGNWMPTMEHLNMDWKEYVQVRGVGYVDDWLIRDWISVLVRVVNILYNASWPSLISME